MTYEQSWQNIYKLLSLVRAIDGHSICFEFSTNFEFKILISESDNQEYIDGVVRHQTKYNLPFAYMYYEDSGEDILRYSDCNGNWGINLTTLQLTIFGSTEGYSIEKVREQFRQLAGMAKKS